MAYGEEKVAIDLRDGEKDGALIEAREGKEQTYYPKQFATHWDCERLQVRQGFAYREEGDQDPPKTITYVTGIARLSSDYDVSVIGEPENRTTTVELSFRPDDSPDLLKKNENETEESRYRLSRSYGRALMGFNRADWEVRSNDQWWLECHLHSTALQHLINAISAGTLSQASLSVRLNNLYTDEPPYVPFSREAHLFLRPDKRDNTINAPEIAFGWLEALGISLGAVVIAPPPELEPDYEQDAREADVTDSAPQPTIQASQVVAARIDALRRTVKWVGGLITLALFLLLFK